MINTIKKLFGMNEKIDLSQLLKDGAILLDVRSKAEYAQGHIKGSINIPLSALDSVIDKLDKNKAVITCCASGMRSANAKGILESHGFTKVYNGGSWTNI